MHESMPQYEITWSDQSEAEDDSDMLILPHQKAWFQPGIDGGMYMNSWQMGLETTRSSPQKANGVYACRKVLSEEVSRLACAHYRSDPDGGKTKLNSALTRILRYPNSFQSAVDFWLNVVDSLLIDGNAYAMASRDDRGAISALTQLRSAVPYVDPETGAIFYGVGIDSTMPVPEGMEPDPKYMLPQRDVFHLRLFTPVHPLIGEAPLVAAVIAAQTGQAISGSTFGFFNRAARPSGYLRTPKHLSRSTKERIRDGWNTNYSGVNTGGTAILEHDIEWKPMTMNAVDAEIVEQYKLQIEDIARVYRVPLFMLGSMEKSTFNNVEQMTRSFYAGGLAFYLELIEAQLARFFSLPMDEFVEFDVDSGLMRSEFKDRVDALTKGVQGGVFAPNEARRREGLPGVPYGDQPMVQQQMVPLSYAAQQTVDNAGSVVEPVEESIVVADPEKMVALVRKEFGIAA